MTNENDGLFSFQILNFRRQITKQISISLFFWFQLLTERFVLLAGQKIAKKNHGQYNFFFVFKYCYIMFSQMLNRHLEGPTNSYGNPDP